MTLLTLNPVEYLPLSESRQLGERLSSIAPKDVSDALVALGRYIENAVFLPLLRSKSVEELKLRVDSLLPVYSQYVRVVGNLALLGSQGQYHLLEKYTREALDEIELLVESEAPGRIRETSRLNSLAAISVIRWICDELWHRILEDVASIAQVSVVESQRVEEFASRTWLYLNCVLRYLDGKVVSVDETILDELAYRARDDAQSWYATLNERGLIKRPEVEAPKDLAADEEDSWLAEAGLEDYLKQLDL